MTETSPAENVLGLSNKDLSLIRHSLEAGGKLLHQVIDGLKHGTSEVQFLILQQSDVILECRVCRNLFRSLPNYLDHKRIYCRELFPNASVSSLLANSFAAEVPIIYPEPPDDAREFVEMSDLISKFNKKSKHLAQPNAALSPKKDKAPVQNNRESIGRALERSCEKRGKPEPLCLRPIKETSVAMQLVPLTTTNINASENRNQAGGGHETDLDNEIEKNPCMTEESNLALFNKIANFPKLLCLKCNYTYKCKRSLIYHIRKYHIKTYLQNCKEAGGSSVKRKTDCDAGGGSNKRAKDQKGLQNEELINLDRCSTKSGLPSMKKISRLAKKFNLVKPSNLKKGWCHICNRYYSGKRGLVFHMFRMHSGSRKVYSCPFCKVKYPSYASALRHVQIVHKCKEGEMKRAVKKLKASAHVETLQLQLQTMLQPDVKVEKCDSKTNALVEKSDKVQSSPKPPRELLSDPPKVTKTKSKISQQKNKFKCQTCFQLFSESRCLQHHITRKHPPATKNDHPYACHICFVAFITNYSLNRHYRLKHNIQENVQENILNTGEEIKKSGPKNVESEQVKTEQMARKGSPSPSDKNCIFHNNKKYQIPAKYFENVSKFARLPSLCLNCEQTFANPRELIWHIIKEHNTDKNAFPCPSCHLSFISSASILRHTKVQHSFSKQQIADLSQELQVWEQQKESPDIETIKPVNNIPATTNEVQQNESPDSKTRKPVNNISDSTNEGQQNTTDMVVSRATKETCTIHDITDFESAMCLCCNRMFSGLLGLMYHISKIHRNLSNQMHKCLQCNKRFETVYEILNHMKDIHNLLFKEKPSSSVKEVKDKRVKETCTLEKTHQVEAQTSQVEAQTSQLVKECADLFKSQCLRCKEIFAGNKGLIAHIYEAHAHPDQTFSCYICSKTFASYALASRHTRNSHIYKGSAMKYVRVNIKSGEEASPEKQQ